MPDERERQGQEGSSVLLAGLWEDSAVMWLGFTIREASEAPMVCLPRTPGDEFVHT